jgi:uncharacterized protein (DUF2236 family)
MMVTAQQYEKMSVYITLGAEKSEFPGMNEELSQAWDQLAEQISEIKDKGGTVEIVSESI